MSKDVKGEAHTLRAGFELLCKFWESNGQVPIVGSKVESWVRQTGTFSEVNVHEAIDTFGSQVSPGRWHARTHTHPNVIHGEIRSWTRCPGLDVQEYVAQSVLRQDTSWIARTGIYARVQGAAS